MPPNAPFDIATTTSPALAWAAIPATISSTVPQGHGRHAAPRDVGRQPIHVEPLRLRHPVGRRGAQEPRRRRRAEAPRVLLLVEVPAAGVRSRLEGHEQPRAGVRALDGGQRPVDRGRVMGEVVDDGHAAGHAPHLLAPLHPAEGLQPGGDLREREPEPGGGRGHAQRVLHVVRPAHREPHRAQVASAVEQVEPRPVHAQREPAGLPVGRPLHRVGLDRAAGPPRDSGPRSPRSSRPPGIRRPAGGPRSARTRSRSGPRPGRCRRDPARRR